MPGVSARIGGIAGVSAGDACGGGFGTGAQHAANTGPRIDAGDARPARASPLILRGLLGLVAAGVVGLSARRTGALTSSGAGAATLVGGAAAAAGWPWALLLIGWFVASSALTRAGERVKAARTQATLPAAAARRATQVWANGAVFSACAVTAVLRGSEGIAVAALGALAAAAADTWATEVGLLAGGRPKSILTGKPVEVGLSGGVTWAGTIGGAAGAAAVAFGAQALALLPAGSFATVAVAGVLGGIGDSVFGASVQATRRCPRCDRWTERATHDCGVATEHGRGWRWMTNDAVNLLATLVGAAAAFLLWTP